MSEQTKGCVVTIGSFDGLHRGHQALIARANELGRQMGMPSMVLSFDRHPSSILSTHSVPIIMSLNDRFKLMCDAGADVVTILRFDHALAAELPRHFVKRVLVDALGVRCIVVGKDFRFGRAREGDCQMLGELGAEYGFCVEPLEDVSYLGRRMSSSRVRRALAEGRLTDANVMLGRPFFVRGTVVKGQQLGRVIGFPTANLKMPPEQCLPKYGVYAGLFCTTDGESHIAAVGIGIRPTITGDHSPTVEAFLPGFSGNLYDKEALLSLHYFLREETKFDSLRELQLQMQQDVQQTMRLMRGVEF